MPTQVCFLPNWPEKHDPLIKGRDKARVIDTSTAANTLDPSAGLDRLNDVLNWFRWTTMFYAHHAYNVVLTSLGRTVNALCTPRILLFVAVKQSLGRRTSSLKMFDERIRDHRMRRTCFHVLYLYMAVYYTLLGECTHSPSTLSAFRPMNEIIW